MRKFSINTEEVNEVKMIQSNGCNAIEFVNLSDAEITIDGMPIPAYAVGMMNYPSIAYYGLEGERMEGVFNVQFGSATTKRLVINRKYYV